MNALWSYFWPPLSVSLLAGIVAGLILFRRRRRNRLLIAGALAPLIMAALWHGPLGAADRFVTQVERNAEATLRDWEMGQVHGQFQRDPLTRRLILSGPADDFQRGELVRIMSELPGVGDAQWSNESRGIPLIAEGSLIALFGYLLGLLLAYLVGLRRRYNAQWDW